jgi:type II secretory pathway predicted ATPase ExeA/LysM repeat protein
MYLEHFGLSAPPFQFTASPTALYLSRTHRDCLAALEWGVLHEPSGLTLLIGDTGVGKTTLVCALLARQYREVKAAYLGNPRLEFEELLSSVLGQLGVRGARANKSAMINALTHFAAHLPGSERIAILVDEAQALSDDALEDFRLLSNLERGGGRKAAQIVLAGQYELARRLTAAPMRQLNERIGARAVLLALTPLECREYIEHRVRLCGATSDKLFAQRALDHIVRHSAGVPRRINALCHNALLLAYSGGVKQVRLAMAREALADYDDLGNAAKRSRGAADWMRQGLRGIRPILGLGLLGVAGFVTGHAVMRHHPVHPQSSATVRSSVMGASAAESAPAPAAAIDPGIILGSSSIERDQPPAQPPSQPAAESPPQNAAAQPPAQQPAPLRRESLAAPEKSMSVVKAEAPVAAQRPKPQPRRYVVVSRGDTLRDIALRYTGSARVRKLLMLNPKIVDAGYVYPGEVINLPPAPSPSNNATVDNTTADNATDDNATDTE